MLDDATRAQHQAADPGASTWLSANAGSGKTRVLTDRVARLLQGGVDPQNILCLTYTKAAASEMQNRLFKRLGEWAMLDDAPLHEELRKLGVEGALGARGLAHARTLFARAIETPGGLKIQTIHSFCAALLRRFPLEAGVSPHFTEMDDTAARLLRDEIVEEMAAHDHAYRLVADLARHHTGADLSALTAEIAHHRDRFPPHFHRSDALHIFDLRPDESHEKILADVFAGDEGELLARLTRLCADGGKSDARLAESLSALDLDDLGTQALLCLESVLLYGESAKEPFGAKVGKVPTKAVRNALGDDAGLLDELMVRVADARSRRIALDCAERTLALQGFAIDFLARYAAAKELRGWVDFDDLILKARNLLSTSDLADWVLFRIDGGVDHILVDEAQDTSPDQWQVIERLAHEFASGRGARGDVARSLFVVGDKKQSIYSFQGADPEAFDRMRAHFGERLAPGPGLAALDLEFSFRSSPAILSAVDATFAGIDVGLGEVRHRPFHPELAGRVDLWPVIPRAESEDEGAWYDPVDKPAPNAPHVLLAEAIAGELRRLLDAGETLPTRDGRRPMTEGDVLILVQRRGPLFHEIIRACKAKGLEVAGADRLRLTAELAVRDLIALMTFLSLPEDDLSLAAALRSPLFGWSEEELHALAAHRPGFLWQALRATDAPAVPVLRDLLDAADFARPYELLERILIRHRGRERLLSRLGPEAEDGLDELVNQALAYERMQVPSLTGFLSWLEAEDVEVRREAGGPGGKIRVMTVHGAKGLESPVVILPDTLMRPPGLRDEILLADDGRLPCWKVAREAEAPLLREAREDRARADIEERMRLLYVAMTRAETWLIACGAGEWKENGDTWYDHILGGLRGIVAEPLVAPTSERAGETGLRLAHGSWEAGPLLVPAPAPAAAAPAPPPDGPVRPPAEPERAVAPSDLGGAKALPGEGLDEAAALRRGSRIHRLLEHLPVYARADWAATAEALLAGDAAPEEVPALLDEARAVLDAPALAPLFDGAALAEVELTARLPDGRLMHGTVDRLVVAPERVLCVDFKTNMTVPEGPEAVPEGLLRQMAAYAHALRAIYPDRPVGAAILWTRAATLMPLEPALLTRALGGAP